MFIPIVAGHELAYWSNGINAPEDRQFQKIAMKLLKFGIAACVALPFVFAAIHAADDRGYPIPQEDTAAITVRKAENKTAAIIMARRTACGRQGHSKGRPR